MRTSAPTYVISYLFLLILCQTVLTADFSMQAVKSQIDSAQKVAGGNGSEQDIAEAKIELEV